VKFSTVKQDPLFAHEERVLIPCDLRGSALRKGCVVVAHDVLEKLPLVWFDDMTGLIPDAQRTNRKNLKGKEKEHNRFYGQHHVSRSDMVTNGKAAGKCRLS